MRLSPFNGKISVLLLRRGWIFRISLTFFFILLMTAFWWFGWQRRALLDYAAVLQRAVDLRAKQIMFEHMLIDYEQLKEKRDESDDKTCLHVCHIVIDQAHRSGLVVGSYTKNLLKNGFKQLIFVFSGDYLGLKKFLFGIESAGLGIDCERLRVVQDGCRLQITYVCGIHTVVKSAQP